MNTVISELEIPDRGALALTVVKGNRLTATGTELDRRTGGALTRAMRSGRFNGEKGECLEIVAPAGTGLSRILLCGVGLAAETTPLRFEDFAGGAARRLMLSGETDLALAIDPIKGARVRPDAAAAHAALGASLGAYRFDKYRTTQKANEKPSLERIAVLVRNAAAGRKAYEPLRVLAEAIVFARNLVTEPANVIYPESLAKEARKLAKLGVKVEVLNEAAMKKLGMGALLAVGQGSERESQLVVMQWLGGGKSRDKVAFVGKGVCFDSGGLSLKPATSMEEMKWDMGGAAAVIGAMMALAGRKARVNAVGVVGLVENMPSGTAQRPGDVVKTMSGQTVEVLNTDAEGRLVLADALWYAQDRFRPKYMIDLATLTGAIVTTLGHERAGLFSNNDGLASRLGAAGEAEGEKLWRLPLAEAYDKAINSDIADAKNIAGPAVGAGSITAAQFLQRFVNKVPWAHVDIAGVAWSKEDKPTVPKGATAFGVRLLDRLVKQVFEGL
jgi:leucyl aminopeptidase